MDYKERIKRLKERILDKKVEGNKLKRLVESSSSYFFMAVKPRNKREVDKLIKDMGFNPSEFFNMTGLYYDELLDTYMLEDDVDETEEELKKMCTKQRIPLLQYIHGRAYIDDVEAYVRRDKPNIAYIDEKYVG